MDNQERLNKMARLVFNKDNLMQVKEGLNLLFDLFIDIVDTPFEHGNCFSHTDVMMRFESVEQKKWRPIRNVFLLDPFYGYVQGDFSDEEKTSPAKVLLDMISVFSQIQQDCMQKLEGYQQMFAALSKEKRQLEAHLAKLELKESEQRVASTLEKTEFKTAKTTIEFLERSLKEKNEKIAELQREKNVQLWEREKERVLADSKQKMEVLEARGVELKRQNESLQKKYVMMEDQYKRLKLKTELASGERLPSVSKSEDELKRQIYLLEKDLTALEQELYNQQRTFSTVLCGIKTDLYIVGESLTDPDSGQIPFKDFVRLNSMVDSLATAMAEGDIESARSRLPPHYTYLPSVCRHDVVERDAIHL